MVTRTRFAASDKAPGSKPEANGKHGQRSADRSWAAIRHALDALGKRLPEMRQDLSYYTAVQVDRARLAAASLVTSVASRVLRLLAFAASSTIAAYLLIVGIAGGLATALQGRVWLANLITGAGVLAVLAVAMAIAAGSRRHRRLRHLQRRYRGLDRTKNTTATEAANDAE